MGNRWRLGGSWENCRWQSYQKGSTQLVPKQKGTRRAVTESVATKHEATLSAAGATAANEQTDGAIRRKKKHERGRKEMERKISERRI